MASVIGASLTGAKSITATSGPGVSLKQELIGYACIAEVPCVIINVMRGGPSTGMPTGPGQSDVMQAMWGTHGDHAAIALVPDSCQEIFTETVRAFNLAEKYRMPVQVLYDEIVGHMRERIVFPEPANLKLLIAKLQALVLKTTSLTTRPKVRFHRWPLSVPITNSMSPA